MILYLGNMLSQHGGSVSVIETLAPRIAQNFPVKAYSSLRSPVLRLMEMLIAIVANARSTKIVLIDAYSSPRAFLYLWATSQLCRLLRIPYAPILHGGDFPSRLRQWPRICAMVFKYSCINIAPSGYLYAAFQNQDYKTIQIPNSIELDNYPYLHRTQVRPRLLWVRAFDTDTYNPQMAIKVLALLTKEYPDAFLCMVGPNKDGSLETCQELTKELGIQDRVTFTGRLNRTEWINLSTDYDIFINTTNFDNMPVSLIEAMALGLPIVSTDPGGVPYIIDDGINGLSVPKDSDEKMVTQIKRLISEAGLANRLAISGRQKAETYDWEHIKPLWLHILNKENEN